MPNLPGMVALKQVTTNGSHLAYFILNYVFNGLPPPKLNLVHFPLLKCTTFFDFTLLECQSNLS